MPSDGVPLGRATACLQNHKSIAAVLASRVMRYPVGASDWRMDGGTAGSSSAALDSTLPVWAQLGRQSKVSKKRSHSRDRLAENEVLFKFQLVAVALFDDGNNRF